MLKILIKLIFEWKIRKLRPDWRSFLVITGPTKAELKDIELLLAQLPHKCIGDTPIIAIKAGADVQNVLELPDPMLQKLREVLWM